MIARRIGVLALGLLLAGHWAAVAQTRPPASPPRRAAQPPPRRAPQPPVRVRGYGIFGITQLAAADTFDAVAGTTRRPVFGGGAQVTNLWKSIFADVAFSRLRSIEGQRVFVNGGTVFGLGIPLQVQLQALDVAAGWRTTYGRVAPYAGGGISYLMYNETSDFADAADNVDTGGAGPLVLGGVDVAISRWLHGGAELRYRSIFGILGENGASAAFNEKNAGGFSAAVRISVGR